MTKQLGSTFDNEVWAAGLGGLPFTWGETDDSIEGRENLTAPQNSTLDSVIAAHDPTKPDNAISPGEFIARFTNQEYIKLEAKRAADIAASKVGNAKNWDIIMGDGVVNLQRQKAQTLKADLVADGILTQARADEIFT